MAEAPSGRFEPAAVDVPEAAITFEVVAFLPLEHAARDRPPRVNAAPAGTFPGPLLQKCAKPVISAHPATEDLLPVVGNGYGVGKDAHAAGYFATLPAVVAIAVAGGGWVGRGRRRRREREVILCFGAHVHPAAQFSEYGTALGDQPRQDLAPEPRCLADPCRFPVEDLNVAKQIRTGEMRFFDSPQQPLSGG